MNRKELYAKVIEYNLQDKIKEEYGDNYTRISNIDILAMIVKHNALKIKSNSKTTTKSANKEKRKLDNLIEVLKKKHILLDSEISFINS